MIGLTARQQEILEAIQANILEKGYAPTVRELCARFGIRSTNAITDHLRALVRKGYLEIDPQAHRGLRVKDVPAVLAVTPPASVAEVPVYGRVEPGPEPFLRRNQLATIRVDARAMGGGDLFALRIQGDALLGMGIRERDTVVFLRRPLQKSGELACLSVGDVVLVRYVHIGRSSLVLMPAHRNYGAVSIPAMSFKPANLLGVAVRMWRSVP